MKSANMNYAKLFQHGLRTAAPAWGFHQIGSRIMVKRRVPAFVLLLKNNDGTLGFKSMEFYCFNKYFRCPTLNENVGNKNKKTTVIPDRYRARPFTWSNDCLINSMFVASRDYIYVSGGFVLSSDQLQALYDHKDEALTALTSEELATIFTRQGHISWETRWKLDHAQLSCLTDDFYTGVKRFDLLKFGEERKGRSGGELDKVYNDSLTCWETCPLLSDSKTGTHLLHLRGKVYVVGRGTFDGTALIQVIEQDVLTSIRFQHHPNINPECFVSAALEEYNKILVGSNGSFHLIDVSNENGEAKWEKLEGLECEEGLILTCCQRPGYVVDKHCILWYTCESWIKGVHLTDKRFFFVELCEDVLVSPDSQYLYSAKLIDLGKGMLCLIYIGTEWKTSIDDHGVEHSLLDYHCVTFEINYHGLLETEPYPGPYPGIRLKPRILSRRKCYAPDGYLAFAFAMDVDIPNLVV